MTDPNLMRHAYNESLSDARKQQIKLVKDAGLNFDRLVSGMNTSRKMSIAITKIEEAVMWAVKDLTR